MQRERRRPRQTVLLKLSLLAPTRAECTCAVVGLRGSGDDASETCKMIAVEINVIQVLHPKLNSTSSLDGAFMFILSKLSKVYCTESNVAFDLCVEIDDDGDDPDGSKSTSNIKKFSATLTRPKNASQMFALLNGFVLLCSATGIANVLVLSPFLEDVVYEPTRIGKLLWMEAFEHLIVYLRLLENNPDGPRMKDIYLHSGGFDSREREAREAARPRS